MQVRDCVASSYAELRPFKPEKTATFPVYPDLVETLVSTEKHPDDYGRARDGRVLGIRVRRSETVAMVMARMGLEENHGVMIDEYVDVAVHHLDVVSDPEQRWPGGDPLLPGNAADEPDHVAHRLNIDPTHVDIQSPGGSREGYVHSGFYRNVRSTRYAILNALKRAVEGRSVRPGGGKLAGKLQALYITGHSLGGASASMLALMLVTRAGLPGPTSSAAEGGLHLRWTDDRQPRTRQRLQPARLPARAGDPLRVRQRHRPPAAARGVRPFAHFGPATSTSPRERRTTGSPTTRRRSSLRNLLEIAAAPLSVLAGDLKLTRRLQFHASLRDHLPQYYIDALTPPGVRSEFGD